MFPLWMAIGRDVFVAPILLFFLILLSRGWWKQKHSLDQELNKITGYEAVEVKNQDLIESLKNPQVIIDNDLFTQKVWFFE